MTSYHYGVREYDIIGWSDVQGHRFQGPPPDSAFSAPHGEHIDGVLARSWIQGDADSYEYTWVYQLGWWEDLEDALASIDESIDMYGLVSIDESIDMSQ